MSQSERLLKEVETKKTMKNLKHLCVDFPTIVSKSPFYRKISLLCCFPVYWVKEHTQLCNTLYLAVCLAFLWDQTHSEESSSSHLILWEAAFRSHAASRWCDITKTLDVLVLNIQNICRRICTFFTIVCFSMCIFV